MTKGIKLARWAWLVAIGTVVIMVVSRLGPIWSEARSVGPPPEYFNAKGQYALSGGQARALTDIGLSAEWHAALIVVRFVLVSATVVGISTLLWRRARTWAPLFLSWFLPLSLIWTAFGDDVDTPDLLALPLLVLFGGGLISMAGLLLVFPDDRSAGWVVALLVSAAAIPVYATATDNEPIGDWLWNYGIIVAGALLVGGLVLQVTRIFRSGDRTGRDLLLITVCMFVVFLPLAIGSDRWSGIQGSRSGLGSLARRVSFETLFMAVPIVYGLAVLSILVRRGHWDMDVQLKGSVGYAGLTTFVVLSYFGVVAVVQALVNDVSGADGNTFALIVSTAVVAAAILPMRSRLQRTVDRVFDRRHRDADRVVAAFETSVVRETQPDDVANSLLNAVEDVFHPEQADVWLLPEVPS